MKKFNFSFAKRQIGIGLLELMLSLSIIAVLLVMATRYYMSAALNSRVNQTADALLSLPAAAECWAASSTNSAAGSTGTYNGINLYAISYTDKCYPTSLVAKSDTSGKSLLTPYGNLAISSTSSKVCANVVATNNAEAQLIAKKICPADFNKLGTTSATFYYEAITQSCDTAALCTSAAPNS